MSPAALLARWDACADARAWVSAQADQSPRALWDACPNAGWLRFALDALGVALSDAQWERVRGPARAEYERVTGPAWAEYERVEGLARAEYERVRESAWAERERASANALRSVVPFPEDAVARALGGAS